MGRPSYASYRRCMYIIRPSTTWINLMDITLQGPDAVRIPPEWRRWSHSRNENWQCILYRSTSNKSVSVKLSVRRISSSAQPRSRSARVLSYRSITSKHTFKARRRLSAKKKSILHNPAQRNFLYLYFIVNLNMNHIYTKCRSLYIAGYWRENNI